MEHQLQAGATASRQLVCLGLLCLRPDAGRCSMPRARRPLSNWGNARTPGNPNNLPLAHSDFDVGHRLNLAASYGWDLPRRFNLTASMYYNGQSGRPYSISYNNTDVNRRRDSSSTICCGCRTARATWSSLTERRSSSRTSSTVTRVSAKAAARSPSATAARQPFTNIVDVKFALRVPAGRDERGAHVRYPELHQPAERRMGPLRVPRLPDAELGCHARQSHRRGDWEADLRPRDASRRRRTASSRSTTCGRGGRASSERAFRF